MKNLKGRILALDYGEKRIGLAISDPLGVTAQGLGTIEYKNLKEAIAEIKNVIARYSVEELVLGLPLNLKGEIGSIAREVQKFADQLKSETGIPVSFWDERLTSVEAERALIQMGKSPSLNKKQIDEIAAILILQGYLQTQHG